MIRAGQRRERVTFQRKGPDENGDALGDWQDDFRRWARVQVVRGGEEILQERQQGVLTVRITVLADRRTRAAGSEWRAMWNGAPYNLGAPEPSEDRAEIAFIAKADQSDV